MPGCGGCAPAIADEGIASAVHTNRSAPRRRCRGRHRCPHQRWSSCRSRRRRPRVSGSLTFRERIALTPAAVAIVTIIDNTAAADAGVIIGQQVINGPTTVPIDFSVLVEDSHHRPDARLLAVRDDHRRRVHLAQQRRRAGHHRWPDEGHRPDPDRRPAGAGCGGGREDRACRAGTTLKPGGVLIAALIKVETGNDPRRGSSDRRPTPPTSASRSATTRRSSTRTSTYVVKGAVVDGPNVYGNREGVTAITKSRGHADGRPAGDTRPDGHPGRGADRKSVGRAHSRPDRGAVGRADCGPECGAVLGSDCGSIDGADRGTDRCPDRGTNGCPDRRTDGRPDRDAGTDGDAGTDRRHPRRHRRPTPTPTPTADPDPDPTAAPSGVPTPAPITGPVTGTLTFEEPHTAERRRVRGRRPGQGLRPRHREHDRRVADRPRHHSGPVLVLAGPRLGDDRSGRHLHDPGDHRRRRERLDHRARRPGPDQGQPEERRHHPDLPARPAEGRRDRPDHGRRHRAVADVLRDGDPDRPDDR